MRFARTGTIPTSILNQGCLLPLSTQILSSISLQGPHVFVVRIRDDAGRLMPGVRIKDQGPKMGLNGVDNGRIWFDHVRVPREVRQYPSPRMLKRCHPTFLAITPAALLPVAACAACSCTCCSTSFTSCCT